MSFVTLIPAAGRSTRMGRTKAWVPVQTGSDPARPMLAQVVETALAAGSSHIIIATGAPVPQPTNTNTNTNDSKENKGYPLAASDVATYADQQAWPQAKITTVPCNPAGHLIDTIRTALTSSPTQVPTHPQQPLLLWPVDCPFASTNLLTRMLRALANHPNAFSTPVYQSETGDRRRGHPLLLGPNLIAMLHTPATNNGVHKLLQQQKHRHIPIPSHDPRVTLNLNTPDDLRQAATLHPATRKHSC